MWIETKHRLVAENDQYVNAGDAIYRKCTFVGTLDCINAGMNGEVLVTLRHPDGDYSHHTQEEVSTWTAQPALADNAPKCLRALVTDAASSPDPALAAAAEAALRAYSHSLENRGKTGQFPHTILGEDEDGIPL